MNTQNNTYQNIQESIKIKYAKLRQELDEAEALEIKANKENNVLQTVDFKTWESLRMHRMLGYIRKYKSLAPIVGYSKMTKDKLIIELNKYFELKDFGLYLKEIEPEIPKVKTMKVKTEKVKIEKVKIEKATSDIVKIPFGSEGYIYNENSKEDQIKYLQSIDPSKLTENDKKFILFETTKDKSIKDSIIKANCEISRLRPVVGRINVLTVEEWEKNSVCIYKPVMKSYKNEKNFILELE